MWTCTRNSLIFLTIAFLCPPSWALEKKVCGLYAQVNLTLNRELKTLQVISKPGKPTELCAPLPATSGPNLLLRLEYDGKVVFERKLYIELREYSDSLPDITHPSKIEGGVREAATLNFATYLPAEWIGRTKTQLEFILLEDGKLFAKGGTTE